MTEYGKAIRQWAQDKQYRRIPVLPPTASSLMKSATSNNCGDIISLYCIIHEGCIHDVGFEGDGCRLFFAASHVFCTLIHTMSEDRARGLVKEVAGAPQDAHSTADTFGVDSPFSYMLAEFPGRRSCILLPWLAAALVLEQKER